MLATKNAEEGASLRGKAAPAPACSCQLRFCDTSPVKSQFFEAQSSISLCDLISKRQTPNNSIYSLYPSPQSKLYVGRPPPFTLLFNLLSSGLHTACYHFYCSVDQGCKPTTTPPSSTSIPLQAAMATQTAATDGFAPILKALATMQSNVAGKEKADAHSFLEKFQKSVRRIPFPISPSNPNLSQSEAWNATHAILQDSKAPVEARLFAATTLKGKVGHLTMHSANSS